MGNLNSVEIDEINNLLNLLKNEFHNFDSLIENMSAIESPYKNDFVHMRSLIKTRKFSFGNLERNAALLTEELNHFGRILDKICHDGEVCKLYIDAGLIEQAAELQKNIMSKFSFND